MAYSASKAAATHLARNLATYFVYLQIRIGLIVPGLCPSELTGSTKSDEKGLRMILSRNKAGIGRSYSTCSGYPERFVESAEKTKLLII